LRCFGAAALFPVVPSRRLHPSDRAGGPVPSVVAEVRDARVAALRVYSHGCE
jgi:hypothetical protein